MNQQFQQILHEELEHFCFEFNCTLEIESKEEVNGSWIITTKKITETAYPYRYFVDSWHLTIFVGITGNRQILTVTTFLLEFRDLVSCKQTNDSR
ncbi:MAG TPA: hypothetical protein VNM69_11805 [Bacillus sp. (in: firmicutes)]|uniref:hypothetical protein n=1 Tax=Bacillus litorisediminis TaxID=2922713 RepID=UPI001FAD585E|nr:hypothetical protein [Bacillus litorisediminis]HWO76562.1 hypothetical protein [Bacillus sp. (in: firmicutes)]